MSWTVTSSTLHDWLIRDLGSDFGDLLFVLNEYIQVLLAMPSLWVFFLVYQSKGSWCAQRNESWWKYKGMCLYDFTDVLVQWNCISILTNPLFCWNRLVEDSFELIVIIALCITECFLVTLLLFHRWVGFFNSASFLLLRIIGDDLLVLVNWCWTCTCNRCICHWGQTVGYMYGCRYTYPYQWTGRFLGTTQCLQVQPVICWHLSFFIYWFEEYFLNAFKMIGNFPEDLSFNRLFLKVNWFICN